MPDAGFKYGGMRFVLIFINNTLFWKVSNRNMWHTGMTTLYFLIYEIAKTVIWHVF
jgi:hypothetical protein